MSVGTIYENFDDLKSLIERHKNEKVPCKNYEFDGTGYALMLKDINKLLQENQQLKKQKEIIDKAIDFIKNGDILYFANKNSVVYRDNIEVRAVANRLSNLLQILEDKGGIK